MKWDMWDKWSVMLPKVAKFAFGSQSNNDLERSKIFSIFNPSLFLRLELIFKNRHFSNVTENIFKNLNLRKKVDRKFRGNSLKNHFRHLKFIFKSLKLIGQRLLSWAPFERQKIEVHIFEIFNFSSLGTWRFTDKEDLNPQKQVFLLNLRLWLAQKPKILVYFLWEKVHIRNFVVWKVGAFSLKISTFPCLLVVAIRFRYLATFSMHDLVAGMWHLKALIRSFTNSKSW